MPKISQKYQDKIQEQILHHLFLISPEAKFTSQISQEIARDEEFTKTLLQNLFKQKLITKINKNSKGTLYKRRQRWRISNNTYEAYKKHQ